MATLIAGHGRGANSGIQGVAPSARVLPVIISRTGRNISSAVMANGVKWATSQQADVLNISAGAGPGFDLRSAVDAAIDADIVVVAAAGNADDAIINYPAAFDGVLAVGTTGRSGKYSSESVKDPRIQLCAPGVDIISAQPDGKYGVGTGSSDSAAFVSGATALVRAKFPQLSAQDVIHRLTATADDIGPPGRDNECGFGRLNIVKALTADVPPIDAGSTPSATPTSAAATTPATTAASPTGTGTAAAPETENAGSNSTLLFGGLAGLVVAGAAALFFVLRRRRP